MSLLYPDPAKWDWIAWFWWCQRMSTIPSLVFGFIGIVGIVFLWQHVVSKMKLGYWIGFTHLLPVLPTWWILSGDTSRLCLNYLNHIQYVYIYIYIWQSTIRNDITLKKIQTLLSLCIKHHGQMLLLLWHGFWTHPKNLHDGSGLPQFKAAELLCSTDLPMGSGRARIVQQGWALGRFSQRQQTCVFFGAIWYIYLQDTIW